VLTFKRKLRDHVIMHYAPYIARLKHDAFARYDPTNSLRHLDCLRSKGLGRDFKEIPIHGFDEGIRILRQKSAPSLAKATSSKVGSNVV
jgi:hypothetical protein